jgi:hypothetical protein
MGLALRMDPRREAWSDAMQKGCRSPRHESMHEKREALVAVCLVGAIEGSATTQSACRPPAFAVKTAFCAPRARFGIVLTADAEVHNMAAALPRSSAGRA